MVCFRIEFIKRSVADKSQLTLIELADICDFQGIGFIAQVVKVTGIFADQHNAVIGGKL